MDARTVQSLEANLKVAIAEVLFKMGHNGLPLLPSDRTMHLMAKGAVTVYEAVVENQHSDEPKRPRG